MLNWWLIVLIVLVPLICIGLAVYVIVYFQSEEDSCSDYVPKAVAGLGLVLALGSILLVPYDVANSPDPTVAHKYNQTLNTNLMWQIVLWAMAGMAVVVCPFFMFFYEAYDPEKPRVGKQIAQGIILTLLIVIVFVLIVGLCYYFKGYADIDFEAYQGTPQFIVATSGSVAYVTASMSSTLTISVSLYTYTIGMLCFIGWILFFFYGGVGIVAYPINLIRGFTSRTKAISASRFAEEMAVVLAKADALLELCTALQRESRGSIPRATKNKINILRNEVYFLEAHQNQIIWAYTKAGGSPFIVYGQLILGIVCLVTGIVWCLQIFIYNTFDLNPFLNTLLLRLNDAFALCGVCAYGVLSFYLTWSTFQGQIALGLRLVFFQIHPMKKHDTLVNSFLFNVSLLLITSYAVIFFVVRSFQDYAALTEINGLMNVFVMQLRGIGVFIKWAQYCFLGMALLAVIWVSICPRKRRDPTKIRLSDI
ncbi:LMBR1-like membrane protein [Novymonas esmeraldas]|uniref:LMBR1-like membrane protein n=1 Tax=Novymonas esmeraldas TaxID=1808958 RepID=A0AAW0F2H4_9TRYP